MSTMPGQIKVGPFQWVVEEEDAVNSNQDTWGQTLMGAHKIIIAQHCPPDRKRATLLHEVMHACTNVNGLNFRLNKEPEHVTEEDVVREMSTTLYGVLRDNPALVEYLMS